MSNLGTKIFGWILKASSAKDCSTKLTFLTVKTTKLVFLRFCMDLTNAILGPHLDRETSGAFDVELGFAPDGWQAEFIAAIGRLQSATVVAPTSSGKTYASYYCMKSVLKESLDGVVVYVSPTKALVNQVAATVYARFKDANVADGMCLLGLFTRDYRYGTDNCQILVTVP